MSTGLQHPDHAEHNTMLWGNRSASSGGTARNAFHYHKNTPMDNRKNTWAKVADFVLLGALSDPGAPDSDLGPFQVIAGWLAGWPAGWLHCQTLELRHVY